MTDGAGRGFLLSFEGVEGTGKSSHLGRLADWLREQGTRVTTTREPGGTPLGESLRAATLDPDGEPPTPAAELFLILAARAQHVTRVLEPALRAGEVVLCDRFSEASLAYQGGGRGLGVERVAAANRLATGGLRADLVLLFDAPSDVILDRLQRRRKSRGLDRLDREDQEFFARVRATYLSLAAAEPDRFVVINTAGDPEGVAAGVRSEVLPRLQAAGLTGDRE